jgi:hypothetical protein
MGSDQTNLYKSCRDTGPLTVSSFLTPGSSTSPMTSAPAWRVYFRGGAHFARSARQLVQEVAGLGFDLPK